MKGRLSRELEETLSLYLDGPLPRGYAERARARLERALAARRGRSSRDPGAVPDGPVLAWWQRLFTMEAAGAVAAVLLVAVLLYPQVRPPSRGPAIESPVPESGPAGAQRGQGRTRTKAEADQETVDALRSLGYISSGRPAAPPAGAKKRSEAKAMPKAGLAPKRKPAAREGAAAGFARPMAAPVAPGA